MEYFYRPWQPWFAWRPVLDHNSNKTFWLQRIYRREVYGIIGVVYYQYTDLFGVLKTPPITNLPPPKTP